MSETCPNCNGENTRNLEEHEAYFGGGSSYCNDCDDSFGENEDPSETSTGRLNYESDEDYRERMEDLGYDEYN